jgi:hypothetical protein
MNTPPPSRPTARRRLPAHERRARERRVLYVGLALSFAIHVALIGLAGLWLDPHIAYAPPPPVDATAQPEAALRGVKIAEPGRSPEPASLEPVRDPTPPRVERPRPPQPTSSEGGPPEAERPAAERRTAAERLAPRMVDPRLWRPMIVLPREPSFADVQDRVGRAIEMLSDSALADAERAVRARDWTVTDSNGDRWGISPGQLHLGSITVPLPVYFPTDMDGLADQRQWYELETQLQRAELIENFDARVRSIRERRDRERSDRRTGGSGGR